MEKKKLTRQHVYSGVEEVIIVFGKSLSRKILPTCLSYSLVVGYWGLRSCDIPLTFVWPGTIQWRNASRRWRFGLFRAVVTCWADWRTLGWADFFGRKTKLLLKSLFHFGERLKTGEENEGYGIMCGLWMVAKLGPNGKGAKVHTTWGETFWPANDEMSFRKSYWLFPWPHCNGRLCCGFDWWCE